MARLHSKKKGKSHSNRPPAVRSTQWLTMSGEEIESIVEKLHKEGLPLSMIGIKLRDVYGVPGVKYVTNKSVKAILLERKLLTGMPEDIENLVRRAQRMTQHISQFKSDRRNVHALELVEAKIYRLSKYYKRKGLLPKDWKYKTVVAQLA